MSGQHKLTLVPVACPHCEGETALRVTYFTSGFKGPKPHNESCVTGCFTCQNCSEYGDDFLATTQFECSCGWSNAQECRICENPDPHDLALHSLGTGFILGCLAVGVLWWLL